MPLWTEILSQCASTQSTFLKNKINPCLYAASEANKTNATRVNTFFKHVF